MTDPAASPLEPARLGRRAVLRTGVWSVPVVAVATAAPAFAVSGVQAELVIDFVSAWGGGPYDPPSYKASTVATMLTVRSGWVANGPSVSNVTLVVSYANNKVTGAAPTIDSGTGWTFVSASKRGATWSYTFLYSGPLATDQTSEVLQFRVPLRKIPGGKVNVTAVASASNATPATKTTSTTL